MKRVAVLICGWCVYVSSLAQSNYTVSLSTGKTTSLVFPFAIRYVDVGTKDVLVQQVKEAENLLLAKAGAADFKTTNISVVTADGWIYSIDVKYDGCPDVTIHYLQPQTAGVITFAGEALNASDMKVYATGILDNPKQTRGIRNRKWDMLAKINGIYVKDGAMLFQLKLNNLSPINYDVDFVRFYIRDKRKLKRTAVQEIELTPLHKIGNISKVGAYSNTMAVYAFDKFTIPAAKHLVIELGEKNGGRQLKLKVGNNKLIRAKALYPLR
jgi:conjugative transposon TraN protein